MKKFEVRTRDVIWNYIGTLMSMGGNFLLIPIFLITLSGDELGLWYSLSAISAFAQLFEFGFNPTFARNLVYCFTGASSLSKSGASNHGSSVDWHLTATVLLASKLIYALVAVIALLLALTLGTVYIAHITAKISGINRWIAWGIFCLAIFLNLFYLWTSTLLRGMGDIAAENKSKTLAKCGQLALSAMLCFCGWGLVGASLGYLSYGLLLRFFSYHEIVKHKTIITELKKEFSTIKFSEKISVVNSISFISIRDGLVQLSLYLATQATSVIASLTLPLSEAGIYSMQLQIANAVGTFSSAYISTCYPSYQSAFIKEDKDTMRQILQRGLSLFWISALASTLVVTCIGLPILSILRPSSAYSAPVFILMSLYSALVQQCSVCCSLIVATNAIPYVKAYVFSSIVGTALSYFLGMYSHSSFGMVLGQLICQCAYNAWHWPRYVLIYLDTTWRKSILNGAKWWWKKRGRVFSELSRHCAKK